MNHSDGSCKRPNPTSPSIESTKKSRWSVVKRQRYESGYTVDLQDLLFTHDRDFLVRNNGQKVVWSHDLKGKTIVLYIIPINGLCLKPGETLDMVQAYQHLYPLGGFEFVFVPVRLHCFDIEYPCCYNFNHPQFEHQESYYYNYLLSTMPWPAVPFSDSQACGDSVVETFSVNAQRNSWWGFPYWVIIDPTSTVVAPRFEYPYLFKIFSGAELYPLSSQRIQTLWDEYDLSGWGERRESRKRLISNWDQLLATPRRDFLLSSNGDRVPISSLKGRVIGLYFCENVPRPPHMDVINKAYQEAKLRGYDFEIVQINFHFHCFGAVYSDADFSEQQRYENINWLTLPFKDPSCKKLQRILKCKQEYERLDYGVYDWKGDCLVIIDSRPPAHVSDDHDHDQNLFEFSGVKIIKQYGIEGYPFMRKTIFEREYTRQKKEVKLQLYFPPGQCHFTRAIGDGRFHLVSDSQLKGKRVIVLLADHKCMVNKTCFPFVSMLKSKYREQADQEEGDHKFEVVYVTTNGSECSFRECIKDMPWLVHPYSPEFGNLCSSKMFKLRNSYGILAAAFDIDGQLIAKEYLYSIPGKEHHTYTLFPFFSPDLVDQIRHEVEEKCQLNLHYDSDD